MVFNNRDFSPYVNDQRRIDEFGLQVSHSSLRDALEPQLVPVSFFRVHQAVKRLLDSAIYSERGLTLPLPRHHPRLAQKIKAACSSRDNALHAASVNYFVIRVPKRDPR